DRLLVALDLGRGRAELLRAHRAGLSPQPADRLLDEAKRTIEREGAAASRCSHPGRGRQLLRNPLLAGFAPFLGPAPTPAAAASITSSQGSCRSWVMSLSSVRPSSSL